MVTKKLDIQAKIILVLVAVILPTFLIVTLAQYKLTRPLLEDEMRQIGLTTAQSLGSQIQTLPQGLTPADLEKKIEAIIQDTIYLQPQVIRMDWIVKPSETEPLKVLASNIDEESTTWVQELTLSDKPSTELKTLESNDKVFVVVVPIKGKSGKKILGWVHAWISLKTVDSSLGAFFKITAAAAGLSVFSLIALLSYFLRKTFANERLLLKRETENQFLSEKLQETRRLLMNSERLSVMGQLTASFAHEVGTPLNAMSGHLQLLQQDLSRSQDPSSKKWNERAEIIGGQLEKIEEIVKSFLQSTAKPVSEQQLVDLNNIMDRALHVVRPRLDAIGVEVKSNQERTLPPLQVVPIEMEQIFLNLFNNAVDSMQEKAKSLRDFKPVLELKSIARDHQGRPWIGFSIRDNGKGISQNAIEKVFQPFYTTKPAGEGTGLGLTICRQITQRYNGEMAIKSQEGNWTEVTVELPYTPELE